MTEQTNAADSKAKTVLEDMDSRKIFNTVDEATTYLAKCQEDFADFESYPAVTIGFTDSGEFDPEVYNDTMQVAVVKLTEKGSAKEGRESQVKAIVIYPSPNPAAVIADPAASDWLAGIIAKEANLVAMRPLRKASTHDELSEAMGQMPTSIAEYITSQRETSSGILETYNSLWQLIKKAIGDRYKSFALANLSKKELRKAMESASYAATVYPNLETRQNKKGEAESYFELAARFGIALAKNDGLDPTIFERMLETRNEKAIEVAGDDDDAEDFDIEAMAAKLATAHAEPEATADESSDTTTSEEQPAE